VFQVTSWTSTSVWRSYRLSHKIQRGQRGQKGQGSVEGATHLASTATRSPRRVGARPRYFTRSAIAPLYRRTLGPSEGLAPLPYFFQRALVCSVLHFATAGSIFECSIRSDASDK
jgi:hypothetical protein